MSYYERKMYMINLGKVVLSSVVAMAILSAVGSIAYAKTGENKTYSNLATYKDIKYNNFATYEMMPGYTQVIGTKEGYVRAYKWARYAEAGQKNHHFYKIQDEKKGGAGVAYLYTTFHKVSDGAVRRYHEGYINQTADSGSAKMEQYCRTVYKGA